MPRGGPDGGDGGRGGSVYLEATEDLNTLYEFRHRQHFSGEEGKNGAGGRRHGAAGRNVVIPVPVGTIVRTEAGDVLADLAETGARAEVARGGRGGLGNAHFATAVSQTPRVAQKGEAGEEKWLRLELRLMADVGLVGMPNAGKSTLLSAISAARPKVADYPFTTVTPLLGVAEVGGTTFVVADIPGLIEGAHRGAGLGLEFLRHVERTRLLIHLLDGTSMDPVGDFQVVSEELRAHSAKLADKPRLVAFNKIDLAEARSAWPGVSERLRSLGVEVRPISAATRDGVRDLLELVAGRLQEVSVAPRAAEEEAGLRVYRLKAPAGAQTELAAEREDGGFRLRGRGVERAANLINVGTPEGLEVLRRRLLRMGAGKALARAGAQEGDLVRVGEVELIWRTRRG